MNTLINKIYQAIDKGLSESLNNIVIDNGDTSINYTKQKISNNIAPIMFNELLEKYVNDSNRANLRELLIYYDNNSKSIGYGIYEVQEKTVLKYIVYESTKVNIHANLNWINTSKITDMSYLFSTYATYEQSGRFNGNISEWDVSNVTDMSNMFAYSQFTGDISKWNVGNVTHMISMFDNSKFNNDISKWDVSNVVFMNNMFKDSKFSKNISKYWNFKNVISVSDMFANCPGEYVNDVYKIQCIAERNSEKSLKEI